MPPPRTTIRHFKDAWRPIAAVGFIAALSILTLTGHLHLLVLALYLIVSLISFITYAIDKSKARQSKWRTPEATLLTIDLICGWPGGLLAQATLRHKNQKTSYQIKFLLVTLTNLLVVAALTRPDVFRSLLP